MQKSLIFISSAGIALALATFVALLTWSYLPLSKMAGMANMREAFKRAQNVKTLRADLEEGSDGTMTVSYRRDCFLWQWDMVTYSEDCLGAGRLNPARTEIGLTVLGLRIQ